MFVKDAAACATSSADAPNAAVCIVTSAMFDANPSVWEFNKPVSFLNDLAALSKDANPLNAKANTANKATAPNTAGLKIPFKAPPIFDVAEDNASV